MVVQGMMQTCERVVIVVCTGNHPDDLFSKDEVREMLSASLLANNILDAEIIFVDDCSEDSEWVEMVLDAAQVSGDTVSMWSGNEAVLKLFEDAGVTTKKITPVPGHVSAEIREMIKTHDRDWMTKVPAGALDVIHKHIEKA